MRAAIGMRVKSGRAIAVVLQGPTESPTVVLRVELRLSAPGRPRTWQPFHRVIDLPWKEALAATRESAKESRAAGVGGLRELKKQLRGMGLELLGVGIVSSSNLDPAKIPNPHIRAHAAEGQFFREAAEQAAKACCLTIRLYSLKTLWQTAAVELRCSVEALQSRVTALGANKIRPWAAEEKEAAAAAWVVLPQR